MAATSSVPSVPETFSSLPVRIVHDEDGRGFIVHDVCKTDTLVGLAIKYGVEVMDIKRTNRLVDDRQMFAQKTLRIPLPGPHPPSAALTTRPTTTRANRSTRASARGSTQYASGAGTKGGSSEGPPGERRRFSPAMGLLRGYYGLKSPPKRSNDDEGTEMLVYKSDTDTHSEEGSISPPSNRWALVSPEEEKSIFGGSSSSKSREKIDSRDAYWNDGELFETRQWDLEGGATRDQMGKERGMVENSASFGGYRDQQGAYGETADESVVGTRTVNSRRGKRSSQAEEVAAVVEELAKAHRDNFVPPGMAGEVGRGGSEEFQGEKLTRRRNRGDSGVGNPLMGNEGAGATLTNRGGPEGAPRSGRGVIPEKGPAPKTKPAAQMEVVGSPASNGWHAAVNRNDLNQRRGDSETSNNLRREEGGSERDLDDAELKKSLSSPQLKIGSPQKVRLPASASNSTPSSSGPRVGSLRRNSSKAAMD